MENPLDGVLDKLSEEVACKIAEDNAKESQPESAKDGFDEDGELENQIEDPKMKEKFNKAKEEAKEKAKEAVKNAGNKAKEAGSRLLNQVKEDFNKLGTDLGILTVGSAQFAARIAMVPPAIISATPMGPGVAAQMVPPMLQQLKAEGDSLSKVYDDCQSTIKKYKLNEIGSVIPIVGQVMSIADTIFATAIPLITMVGSSVAGSVGSLPDVKPPITITYNAKDCTNFNYTILNGEVSAGNCSRFTPMNAGDKVSCNKCKLYNKRV